MRCLHTLRKFSPNNAFLINYFNKYRQTYRKVIKRAKDKYFGDRLESADNRQKEVWRIVNSLRGIDKYNDNNSHLDADTLNSFYCSVASQLGKNIPDTSADPLSLLQSVSGDSFYFTPVTAEEIMEILIEIRNKCSSGWDNISIKVLMTLPRTAICTLAHCINASFLNGEFPDLLKRAIVIPIFKQGEDDASNYRPIYYPHYLNLWKKCLKKEWLTFWKQITF